MPMRPSARSGIRRPVSMLRVDGPVTGERVLTEKRARTLISLMESVSRRAAPASRRAIPGYRVSGKTGTAWKARCPAATPTDHFVGVFGGVVPATHPRLAAVVVIDDPSAGLHQGGDVAAPVFSAVVGGALRLHGRGAG